MTAFFKVKFDWYAHNLHICQDVPVGPGMDVKPFEFISNGRRRESLPRLVKKQYLLFTVKTSPGPCRGTDLFSYPGVIPANHESLRSRDQIQA